MNPYYPYMFNGGCGCGFLPFLIPCEIMVQCTLNAGLALMFLAKQIIGSVLHLQLSKAQLTFSHHGSDILFLVVLMISPYFDLSSGTQT